MVPMRGCCFGSTTRVRDVPIASGWPGQSAARVCGATSDVSNPTMLDKFIANSQFIVVTHNKRTM